MVAGAPEECFPAPSFPSGAANCPGRAVDQHDGIVHNDPCQHDDPDQDHHADAGGGDKEGSHDTQQGEGQRKEDDQGVHDALECAGHDDVDKEDGQAQGTDHAAEAALHLPVLPGDLPANATRLAVR